MDEFLKDFIGKKLDSDKVSLALPSTCPVWGMQIPLIFL